MDHRNGWVCDCKEIAVVPRDVYLPEKQRLSTLTFGKPEMIPRGFIILPSHVRYLLPVVLINGYKTIIRSRLQRIRYSPIFSKLVEDLDFI